MAGRLQAVALSVVFAVLAMFLPPFSLLSGGTVGLVSLRKGWQAGLFVAGVSTTILALLSFLLGDPVIGLVFGLSQWLPVLLLALVLRETGSWASTFQLSAVVLALMVGLAHVLIPDLSAYWQSLLNTVLEPVLKQASPDEASQMQELLVAASGLMTGVLAASMMSSAILALFFARAWQAQLYNPGGFGEEFRALRLGNWMAYVALGLFVAAAFTRQNWIQELAVVFLLPFFFQGVAVMHGLKRLLQWHVAALIIMYGLMVVALPQMMALLTAIGLIDSFADFRRRLAPKSAS
jgi:uncharacterized protein YybS (DUF2232 family)